MLFAANGPGLRRDLLLVKGQASNAKEDTATQRQLGTP